MGFPDGSGACVTLTDEQYMGVRSPVVWSAWWRAPCRLLPERPRAIADRQLRQSGGKRVEQND